MAKIQQTLTPKQIQELSLKPKMLQSLQILTLPIIEMETKIRNELELNPILELEDEEEKEAPNTEESSENSKEEDEDIDLVAENLKEIKELSDILDSWNELNKIGKGSSSSDDDYNPFDSYAGQSAHEALAKGKQFFLTQLERLPLTEEELFFAKDLLDSIDEFGYLRPEVNIDDLGREYLSEEAIDEFKKADPVETSKHSSMESYLLQKINKVHKSLMSINPRGITARTVPECLLAQIPDTNLEYDLMVRLLSECFDDLIHRRYKVIASKLSIPLAKVHHIKDHISLLNPKPGLYFLADYAECVIPDVIIKKIADEYEVIVNDSSLPSLTISSHYRSMLQSRAINDKETLNFIRDKINSAKFVIKSIYMRNRTIHRVTKSIIHHQKGFFYKNTGILEPLTYNVIANDLGICESTVSRVVRNKYVDTPFGIFCLKEFFTSTAGKTAEYEDVSRQNVERHIRRMIAEEDKKNPISDLEIANKLKKININVSRRVIAKYRESMGLLNSRLRRLESE